MIPEFSAANSTLDSVRDITKGLLAVRNLTNIGDAFATSRNALRCYRFNSEVLLRLLPGQHCRPTGGREIGNSNFLADACEELTRRHGDHERHGRALCLSVHIQLRNVCAGTKEIVVEQESEAGVGISRAA